MISKQLFSEFDVRRGGEINQLFNSILIQEIQATRVNHKSPCTFLKMLIEEEQKRGVRGVISFRLMADSSTSISPTKLTTLGNRIKDKFGVGNGKLGDRGRNLATYKDVENGYELQILTHTKAHAIDLIKDVLHLPGHTYQSRELKYHTNEDDSGAYPAVQTAQKGKSIKRSKNRL